MQQIRHRLHVSAPILKFHHARDTAAKIQIAAQRTGNAVIIAVKSKIEFVRTVRVLRRIQNLSDGGIVLTALVGKP